MGVRSELEVGWRGIEWEGVGYWQAFFGVESMSMNMNMSAEQGRSLVVWQRHVYVR